MLKSISDVYILGKLNSQEWLRLKFFHIILFFGIVLILFSHLLSALTFSVQERLLYDFGLAGLELALIIVSCIIGSHSIQRDIDRKTMQLILSRPISRTSVVLGAWLSIFILNFIFVVGFVFCFYLTTSYEIKTAGLLLAIYSSFFKSLVVAAFAIAMSVLVRPILALAVAFSYWIFCHSIPDIEYFVNRTDNESIQVSFLFIKKMVPSFYLFNWKSYYYVVNQVSTGEFFWSFFQTMGWIAIWLFMASLFFKRKEIV